MKIDVTALETFRYWRDTEFENEEFEHRVLSELLARIRGEQRPKSEVMLRGIAFSDVLEDPDAYLDGDRYSCDGFEFAVADIVEFGMRVPLNAMHEIWLPRYYMGDDYLVGRADAMHGATIWDWKLIQKAFNARKYDSYADSVQWKAELMMADAEEFRYLVAQAKVRAKDGLITLNNVQELTFYRTDSTDEQVRDLMRDYSAFTRRYA